mgnify:FL=1
MNYCSVCKIETEQDDCEICMKKVDNVNSPSHYNSSGIECIDAMEAMTNEAVLPSFISYCWCNCFKYLWRWPYKNGLEDLKKARWYLDRLIESLEEKK